MLLRVASAYRTVSVQAPQVITDIVPTSAGGGAQEVIYICGGGVRLREEARETTCRLRQEEWESLQGVGF